jgi:hypothetical protein
MTRPELMWRYSWGGRVRHCVHVVSGEALCGLYRTAPRGWSGDSTYEREIVAGLPPCGHCVKKAAKL